MASAAATPLGVTATKMDSADLGAKRNVNVSPSGRILAPVTIFGRLGSVMSKSATSGSAKPVIERTRSPSGRKMKVVASAWKSLGIGQLERVDVEDAERSAGIENPLELHVVLAFP